MKRMRKGEMRKWGKRMDMMIVRHKCPSGGQKAVGQWWPSASVVPVLLCSFHASSWEQHVCSGPLRRLISILSWWRSCWDRHPIQLKDKLPGLKAQSSAILPHTNQFVWGLWRSKPTSVSSVGGRGVRNALLSLLYTFGYSGHNELGGIHTPSFTERTFNS